LTWDVATCVFLYVLYVYYYSSYQKCLYCWINYGCRWLVLLNVTQVGFTWHYLRQNILNNCSVVASAWSLWWSFM